MPLARLERLALAAIEGAENEASKGYEAKFLRELELIQGREASSMDAIAAVFALGGLLGADYLNNQQEAERVGAEARQYSKDARRPVLGVLTLAAGLDQNGSIGNLKMNRVAAVVCGIVMQSAMTMCQVYQMEQTSKDGHQGTGALLLGSVASNEPKSYSRLDNNTSYLRAVFDACVHLTKAHEQRVDAEGSEERALLYLTSLTDTPGPLPTVNWFNLLVQMARISRITRRHCFLFASTHAATSQSLTEYVIAEVGQAVVTTGDTEMLSLAVGETGLGKLLDLSGLLSGQKTLTSKRRGMDAVTSKTHISNARDGNHSCLCGKVHLIATANPVCLFKDAQLPPACQARPC